MFYQLQISSKHVFPFLHLKIHFLPRLLNSNLTTLYPGINVNLGKTSSSNLYSSLLGGILNHAIVNNDETFVQVKEASEYLDLHQQKIRKRYSLSTVAIFLHIYLCLTNIFH